MKYVKPLIPLFLLLTVLLASSACFSKPMPSLSLKLKWQDEEAQFSPRTMVLSVFSHVATDDLAIIITLPNGAVLLDGDLETINSIKKSQPIERRFVVEIDENTSGDIKVEARINYTGHTSFYAAGLLPIRSSVDESDVTNKKSSSRSLKPEKKENYKRVLRNGEWLREYQLP